MKDIELLDYIYENLSDDQNRELISYRGGCRCHISPPCHACSERLTIPEAKHLGWWEEKGAGK